MSALRSGRFDRLEDDAVCQRRDCGRPFREHRPGSYGPPQARVDVLSVCPPRRRITYPTPYSVGPYRLVTFRHRRGYAIADADGSIAWTTPHPITGRPVPMLEPDARRALRMAAEILKATP